MLSHYLSEVSASLGMIRGRSKSSTPESPPSFPWLARRSSNPSCSSRMCSGLPVLLSCFYKWWRRDSGFKKNAQDGEVKYLEMLKKIWEVRPFFLQQVDLTAVPHHPLNPDGLSCQNLNCFYKPQKYYRLLKESKNHLSWKSSLRSSSPVISYALKTV